ncbi:GumC family protein [Rhizobium populisoli]|uniref:GumC family protein n=1 Tax=Rhizobium populisoli TaxID=2859785 RepID=UPI001FE95FB6|nr:GumC family protein [Rhizobium populisoli]
MYRPREPENRRPASYASDTARGGSAPPSRRSLLDRIEDEWQAEENRRLEADRWAEEEARRAADERRMADERRAIRDRWSANDQWPEDDRPAERSARPETHSLQSEDRWNRNERYDRRDYHDEAPDYRDRRQEEPKAAARYDAAPEPQTNSFNELLNAQMRSLSEIGIGDILLWLRRGLRWIILLTIIGMISAFLYSTMATPRYTVYTDIIIDPQNLNVVNDDVFSSNPQRDSQLLEVESTLRVLTSGNVLRQAIADLDLTNDPEFTRQSPLAPLMKLFSGEKPPGDKELAVLMELSDRVKAMREERSFVVTLAVWAEDPEKSIKISEAIVRAFEKELFASSADSAGRVAATLTSRLDELRSSVTHAEEKVEQFKRDNNIQESNTGELASARISTALDTQVLDAQQQLIQAESRYNQMRSAVADRRTATATIFDSVSMQTLRASYNTLLQQIGSTTLTYGARHPRLISMQSEKAALEKAIADEANRILETARTDADQARATLAGLRGKADTERSTVYTNNDAQVRLRELERDARAKAAVYETYLGRTHQITERQQIDTSNVRVISPPVPPKTKSWPPRTIILLAAGAVGGFMLGTGLALLLGGLGHLSQARRRFAYEQRYA